MLRILTLVLFLRLSSATVSPEITTYAKVSKNGQLARSSHDSFSWITRPLMRNNTNVENESRSMNNIVITVSPVYIPPNPTPKLKKGEAINHPVPPRYSTLDHDMIAKLDATKGRKQIQHRFHPPANFEHSIAHANGRPQKGASISNMESSSSLNSSTFPGPIFSNMYDYSPPKFLDDEPPVSKPIFSKYPPMSEDDKIPDSYKLPPSKYHASNEDETDYSSFDPTSSYENDKPAKPMKFANHHDHPPSFVDDPYEHNHQYDFHHDVIYDHIPEYHEHHTTTTEEPEMNDQRLDKRPYSYYFIGKKLWYIPLYFSIYFVIYIAALVLKSVARHKINFPAHLAEAATNHKRSVSSEGWENFVEKILEKVELFAEISGNGSYEIKVNGTNYR